MRPSARLVQTLMIMGILLGSLTTLAVAGAADPLFINLTTDEPHRAHMGISFGQRQLERGHPLTIFLNDRGVLIAARGQADKLGTHQSALVELMARGATVIVCPMCMKHYGVTEADLVPGMQVGTPELTGAALFKDDTQTLSW